MHTKAEKNNGRPGPACGGLIELQIPSLGITLTGAIEISRFGLTPQPPIRVFLFLREICYEGLAPAGKAVTLQKK